MILRSKPMRRYSGRVPTVEIPAMAMALPFTRVVKGNAQNDVAMVAWSFSVRTASSKAHKVHSAFVLVATTLSSPSPKAPAYE